MLGFVILNYVNWKVTCECIQSIIENVSIAYKIVVVDNGSDNESIEEINNRYGEIIKVIPLVKNIGFSAGNNIGLYYLNSLGIKYCILTNSDIIFKKNTAELLLESIIKNEDALLIGPKILNTTGECQLSSLKKPITFLEQIYIGKIFPKKRIDEEKLCEIEKVCTVSGCCFIVRVSTLLEIKALDDNVFLYNEENIFGIKAIRNKLSIYFCPNSEVIHKHRSSTNKNGDIVELSYIKSSLYYWSTYRNISKCKAKIIILFFNIRLILKYKNCDCDRKKIIFNATQYLNELY